MLRRQQFQISKIIHTTTKKLGCEIEIMENSQTEVLNGRTQLIRFKNKAQDLKYGARVEERISKLESNLLK